MIESSKYVKAWRELVAMECRQFSSAFPAKTPVQATLTFFFRRAPSWYRKNGQLRKGAPVFHVQRPDLDKLTRAVFDALQMSGVLAEDSQVCDLRASKCLTDDTEGVYIRCTEWIEGTHGQG